MKAADWPHGLRCGECCRVLDDGDSYSERLTGMVGDTPLVMIVCVPCATASPGPVRGREGDGGG